MAGKRLAGAAAMSLVTIAAATGVLATAPAASAQAPAAVAVSTPFLKTGLGSFEKWMPAASFMAPSNPFLKLT
jgi:hypothetical protein